MESISIIEGSESFFKIHLSEIIAIDKNHFGTDCWQHENFMKYLPAKFDCSLFALERQNVVGYNIMYEPAPAVLHISRLAVSKSHKGEGIGKKLIEHSFEMARKKNYRSITLEFDEKLNVRKFYEKQGFKELDKKALVEYLNLKNKQDKIHLYLGGAATRVVMDHVL